MDILRLFAEILSGACIFFHFYLRMSNIFRTFALELTVCRGKIKGDSGARRGNLVSCHTLYIQRIYPVILIRGIYFVIVLLL